MAIALSALSAFEQFLDDPAGVLPDAAMNPGQVTLENAEPDDAGFAYLTDDALPDPASGCIIGVIDDAIPFAHERLRLANGASRVAAVWMQDARWRIDGPGRDLPSGAEWRGAELTALLRRAAAGEIPGEEAIYRLTGAIDLTHEVIPSAAFATGHGAAVALEAAGFAGDDPQAQRHPVIAVSLPTRITADTMGTLATIPLIASIIFVISRARGLCRLIEQRRGLPGGSVRLPVVINISLGLTAGSRDGASILERFMDAVSQTSSNDLGQVHFVLPTGNHRQSRLSARLRPGQDIGWRLQPDDPTINAMEIWGPPLSHAPRGDLQITLTLPGMAPATTALKLPWQFSVLRGTDGTALARAYYTPHQLASGQWRDGITIIALPTCPQNLGEPFAPPGEWRVGIAAASPQADYDITVQRDEVIRGFRREARQSWLYDPVYRQFDAPEWPILTDEENGAEPHLRRRGTVNAYACGDSTIRAGAAYHLGRTRFDDRLRCDEALPADYCSHMADGTGGDVMARVDLSVLHEYRIVRGQGSGSFARASGTSVAAPLVTRWLAEKLASGATLRDRGAIRAAATGGTARDAGTPILDENIRFPAY